MGDKNLLQNLVELTKWTKEHNEEEITNSKKRKFCKWLRTIEPCTRCPLPTASLNKESPYYSKKQQKNGNFNYPVPLVFFTEKLYKVALQTQGEKHIVDIMIISRDPHACYSEVLKDENTFESIKKPRITGVGHLIIALCGLHAWRNFIHHIKNGTPKISNIYWTHLSKCNTNNNAEFAKCSSIPCREFLKEEIKWLNPKLCICVGGDAGESVFKILESNKKISRGLSKSPLFKYLQEFLGKHNNNFPVLSSKYQNGIVDWEETKIFSKRKYTGLVILPHCSGASCYPYYWKKKLILKMKKKEQKEFGKWASGI